MRKIQLQLSLFLMAFLTLANLLFAEDPPKPHLTPAVTAEAQDNHVQKLQSLQSALSQGNIGREQFQNFLESSNRTIPGVEPEHIERVSSLVDEYRQVFHRTYGSELDNETLISHAFTEPGAASSGNTGGNTGGNTSGNSGDKETPQEKTAREEAEKRAAKKAAAEKDNNRLLEQQLAQQLAGNQQGGQQGGGKGKGSGSGSGSGQDSGGSSQGSSGFPSPQNSNNDSSQNQFGNSFDRLANRLNNLGNQGFGNFSSNQTQSKKDDEKQNSFSLPAAKNSSNNDFSLDSKPKSSSSLPQLATQNQEQNFGKSNQFGIQGTPIPVAPDSKGSWNSNSSNASSMNSSMANNGNNPTMGGMLGGSMGPGQAGMGSFNQDFPFRVTGESYDPEAEADGGPRYRVYDVSMGGASAGGGEGSDGDTSSINEPSTQTYKKIGVPQFLYFATPDEQSLKNVPGIFRSLAAGYKKTRIQLLCSLKDRKKIGLCEKVRNDLDS